MHDATETGQLEQVGAVVVEQKAHHLHVAPANCVVQRRVVKQAFTGLRVGRADPIRGLSIGKSFVVV